MAKKNFKQLDRTPNGVDVLSIRYVALSTIVQWDRNFKKHDIGGVINSIKQHGFKDPFKYEPTLNNGEGGVVEGNGRAEALREWKKLYDAGEVGYTSLPRGIVEQGGEWFAPMIFGVDADSQSAAEAYAIDHNNLTMLGGDFTGYDVSRMWGVGYSDLLLELASASQPIASVSVDELDMLMAYFSALNTGGQTSGTDVNSNSIIIKIRINDVKKEAVVIKAVRALLERNKKWNAEVEI
jgi:hypothetical protein